MNGKLANNNEGASFTNLVLLIILFIIVDLLLFPLIYWFINLNEHSPLLAALVILVALFIEFLLLRKHITR